MRWKAYIPADPFTRFDPAAFDRNVGRPTTVRSPDDETQIIPATLVAAEVDADGEGVTLTFESLGHHRAVALAALYEARDEESR